MYDVLRYGAFVLKSDLRPAYVHWKLCTTNSQFLLVLKWNFAKSYVCNIYNILIGCTQYEIVHINRLLDQHLIILNTIEAKYVPSLDQDCRYEHDIL